MQQTKGKRAVAEMPMPSEQVDRSEPGLDRASQARIGDQLRAMYDDLMNQPVPDRFRDLLAQLGEGKAEDRR